jgi:hypothetical protein
MQRLLTPNGGMPLELDDFNFIQDAYKEAIGGLLRAYVSTYDGNCILSGCVPTETSPNVYTITAGFVMLGYEIRYYPGQTGVSIPIPGQRFFVEDNYNDPAGFEIFEDTVGRDTYQKRDAKLQNFTVSPPANSVPAILQEPVRLENMIPRTDFIPEYDSLSYLNSFTPQTVGGLLPAADEVLVERAFGRVQFRGQIAGGTIPNQMFVVAARFRPSIQGMDFTCPYGIDGLCRVQVTSTGSVSVTKVVVAPTSGTIIDLSQISYTVK